VRARKLLKSAPPDNNVEHGSTLWAAWRVLVPFVRIRKDGRAVVAWNLRRTAEEDVAVGMLCGVSWQLNVFGDEVIWE
jgi:hypothetical protein